MLSLRWFSYLTSIIILLWAVPLFAQGPDTLWTRGFGGTGDDLGQSVQQTSDGGYIVAGHIATVATGDDVYLIRIDANGDTLWTRTYGGAESDQARAICQTTDGGYIVVGRSNSFGEGNWDMYLLRTDPNGDTLWTRTYGGLESDEGMSVLEDTNGRYIIAGSTTSFGSGAEVYLIRTEVNGDTLWARTYGRCSDEVGFSVQQTYSDNGYIIVGYTLCTPEAIPDVYIVKTDSMGTRLWERQYGGSDSQEAYSVVEASDGGYVLVGRTGSPGDSDFNVLMMKVFTNGDSLWTRSWGGSQNDYGHSVHMTPDGGYIIAGETKSFGAGDWDFYLIRTHADGDTIWTAAYGGPGDDAGYSVDHTFDDSYIVAGYTSVFAGGDTDAWVLKTMPDQAMVRKRDVSLNDQLNTRVLPNPSGQEVCLMWDLRSPRPVRVTVWSTLGRRVRLLIDEQTPEGTHQVTWNGLDDSGHSVPPGIYFLLIQAGYQMDSRKVVLVR